MAKVGKLGKILSSTAKDLERPENKAKGAVVSGFAVSKASRVNTSGNANAGQSFHEVMRADGRIGHVYTDGRPPVWLSGEMDKKARARWRTGAMPKGTASASSNGGTAAP